MTKEIRIAMIIFTVACCLIATLICVIQVLIKKYAAPKKRNLRGPMSTISEHETEYKDGLYQLNKKTSMVTNNRTSFVDLTQM